MLFAIPVGHQTSCLYCCFYTINRTFPEIDPTIVSTLSLGLTGPRWVLAKPKFDQQSAGPYGLVTVLRRSPITICHLGFESGRADTILAGRALVDVDIDCAGQVEPT